MPSDRRAEALLRAGRLADRQETVGRLRSAVYAAFRSQLGHRRFRRSASDGGAGGERGGAFVGLNPIHALYPANPESASPYSPSSRRWLNLAYIDVNAVEDFQRSDAAQRWWQKPATQKQLAKARAAGGWITPP